MKWVYIFFAVTVLFVSSCSPQASVNPTAVPTAIPSIQMLPFNFRYREVEDGWNIGYMRLYFINTASQTVPPFGITINAVEITTAENRNYSGELYSYRGDVVNYRGDSLVYLNGIQQLSFPVQIRVTQTLGIPPQMPIVVRGDYGSEYVIQFRYARAATPTTAVLSTSLGQIIFDLSEVAQDLPEPSPPSELVHELSDFASIFDFEDENINLIFETHCAVGSDFYGQRTFGIRYTIRNLDAFGERSYARNVETATYSTFGALRERTSESLVNKTLGPSQSENDYFGFAYYVQDDEPQPLYLIYYANRTDVRIYPIDDCTPTN